jgi:hypothetical protein
MKSIPLMVGALCMLTVSVMAQSLGEVAKKAEAERQVQKAASKVYTDTDLKDLSRPAAAPAAPTATREQSEGDRPDEYRKIARKDEASWKERMRHAQAALDADRVFLAAPTLTRNATPPRRERCAVYPRRSIAGRGRWSVASCSRRGEPAHSGSRSR